MTLNSSDGTYLTIEEMKKSCRTLNDCYLRILEINKGTYRRDVSPIQFDYCTCPELANWTDSLKEVIKKLEKVVYQK